MTKKSVIIFLSNAGRRLPFRPWKFCKSYTLKRAKTGYAEQIIK